MDYLETLSYNVLQQWAKKFKIRANQKGAKLRMCLLEHIEEIKLELNVPNFHPPPTPPSSSTPTKSSSKEISSVKKPETVSYNNSPKITEEQAAAISYRRNSFDDVCLAGEKEFMKSFETNCSRLLESFNRSPQLVPNEDKSSDLAEGNCESRCSQPESEKRLNTTYDLNPCNDSMKENMTPERGTVPPCSPQLHGGNGSVLIIEEESAFFIYENSEVLTPDKETKKVSIRTPKREVKTENPPPVPTVAAVKFNDAAKSAKKSAVTPQPSSALSKPKASKSAGKAPNFQLMHQRQFAKMESIADFQKRLLLSANKSKIAGTKSLIPLKTPSVAPVKPVAPGRANKPTVAQTLRPKGVLTAYNPNIKHPTASKTVVPSNRRPLPSLKEKRKLEGASTVPAPPKKKMRLDPPNMRRVAAWK